MIYIPTEIYKDKNLEPVVHEFIDPYSKITWEELLEEIKDEKEVIEILVKHNYDKKLDPKTHIF